MTSSFCWTNASFVCKPVSLLAEVSEVNRNEQILVMRLTFLTRAEHIFVENMLQWRLNEEDSGRQARKQRLQLLRQQGKVKHINPDQSTTIWHVNTRVVMFGTAEGPSIIPLSFSCQACDLNVDRVSLMLHLGSEPVINVTRLNKFTVSLLSQRLKNHLFLIISIRSTKYQQN